MKLTEEKSIEQAQILQLIALHISSLDVEYLRECAKASLQQANRQETLSVLNPSYPQAKTDQIRLSGQALNKLCEYIDLLKQIDEVKKKINEDEIQREKINRMFL